jgi:hypothetical protein
MKRSKVLILLVLTALSAGLKSCHKDENQRQNTFTHGEKETVIGMAFMLNDGNIGQSGYFGKELYLFENSLSFFETNGALDSISGKGDAIGFMLLTNDSTGIATGDYRYNPNPQDLLVNTFGWESEMVLDLLPGSGDQGETIHFSGGKLSVLKLTDSEYEITFKLNSTVNTTINGYYKGKIKTYQY